MNKALLILIALVAVGAILFTATDLFTTGTSGSSTGVDGADADLLQGEGDSDGADVDGSDSEPSGPVLFTRSKKRFGIGSLHGQLKWFQRNEPAENVEVSIKGTGRRGELIETIVRSDAHGVFSVPVLPAADDLRVVASNDEANRTVTGVSVEPGAVTDLGVIWLGKGGVLRGRVVDPDGGPIAGAHVGVHRGFASMMDAVSQIQDLFKNLDRKPVPMHAVKTAADGTFVVEGVAPGEISVVAEADDFEAGVHTNTMTSKGPVDVIEITLTKGTPVRGQVVNPDGQGIGGARIALLRQADFTSGLLGRSIAITNAQGHFDMLAPPGAGDLGVFVAADSYPSSVFEIKPDALTKEQRFVMHGGATLDLQVLVAETDVPLANADLLLFIGMEKNMGGDPKHMLSAVTDDEGRVKLDARPGNIQMVWVKHPDVGSQLFAGQLGAANAAITMDSTTIDAGANRRTAHVNPGMRVKGVVKSTEGTPLAGVRVRSIGGFGVGSDALSNDAGEYECLVSGMAMGGLIATAPGWIHENVGGGMGMGTMPKPDKPGGTVEFDITMKRAVSVSGRVVDKNGNGIAGARVRASGAPGNMLARMFGGKGNSISGPDGKFVLDGIDPTGNKLRVVARRKGYVDSQSEEFSIGTDAVTTAPSVTMTREMIAVIRVLDPRGNAIAGASVEAALEGENAVSFDDMRAMMGNTESLRTNAAGEVKVPGLGKGTLSIEATADGFAGAKRKHLFTGDEDPLVVSLRVSVPVKGRVLDQHGDPVVGARAMLIEQTGEDGVWLPSARTDTDKEGYFVLEGLPDVSFDVRFTKDGHNRQSVAISELNRDDVRVTLVKFDPEVAAKIKKLEEDQQALYMEMGSVMQNGNADSKEMREIREKLSAIGKEIRLLKNPPK